MRVESNQPATLPPPERRRDDELAPDDAFGAMFAAMVQRADADRPDAGTGATRRGDRNVTGPDENRLERPHATEDAPTQAADSTSAETADAADADPASATSATDQSAAEATEPAQIAADVSPIDPEVAESDGLVATVTDLPTDLPADATTAETPGADAEAAAVTGVDADLPSSTATTQLDRTTTRAIELERPAALRDAEPVAPTTQQQAPTISFHQSRPAANVVHEPAPTASTPLAAPAPAADQVVQSVRALANRKGVHQIQLELMPAELGKVSLEVRFERGTVHVHVRAESAETALALQSQINDLRNQLEQSGLQAGSLDVDAAPQRFYDHDEQEPTSDQREPDDHLEVIAPTVATPTRSTTSELLDVRM